MPSHDRSRRSIRSYVRRRGRITPAQKRAIEKLWPAYGVEFTASPPDLDQLFGRPAIRVLEIGFGNGECLLALASRFREIDFLGVDVHEPGVGHLFTELETAGLTNVRVYCHDAVEVLETQIKAESLAGVNLFFPDPWPKKRHHKRRIVQEEYVSLVASRLLPGGFFHIATDWADYADQISHVMSASSALTNVASDGDAVERPETRPLTHFERRGLGLGHEVRDFLFLKKGTTPDN